MPAILELVQFDVRQRGFPPFEFLLVERDIKELKNMRAKTKQRYRSQFLDAGNRRCPLCLREFGDDVIPTLEHVPPAAIDGRALCLTCEDCNGPRAKHLDTALIDKSRGVVSGTIALLEIGMRAFKMKIEPTQRGLHVSVQDPRVIDFFSERRSILRAQGEIREHLTLSFRFNKHTDVGWLRHAYLALFAFCGDECLDWPSLEIVRQQIGCPDSRIIGGYCATAPTECSDWEGIFVIGAPLWCWGIMFERRIVALPHNNDMTLYQRLQDPERSAASCEAKGIRGGLLPFSESYLGNINFQKDVDICATCNTNALFGLPITITDDTFCYEGVVVAHYPDNRVRFWTLSTQPL